MLWVLEEHAFLAEGLRFAQAAREAGHQVVSWDDLWWIKGGWPKGQPEQPVLFRGSLDNVARVARELPWRPGVWGAVESFACSAWYERAARWMLPGGWRMTTAQAVIEDEHAVDALVTSAQPRFFVRPDSPLKPFAGKVLTREELSWSSLEHGFYYDDRQLPVVLRPWHPIGREWRFVVVGGEVVAGSEYVAQGRRGQGAAIEPAVWRRAQEIASDDEWVDHEVYVLDLCECQGELYLMELNPFAGASLYDCDEVAIITSVEAYVSRG